MTIFPALALCLVLSACLGSWRHDERTVVAVVGERPIYVKDLQRRLARVSLEADKEESLPKETLELQKRATLDDLIDRRLVVQEAEAKHVFVGSDEVETVYGRMLNGWQEEDFLKALKEQNLTVAELKADLRENLLIRKYFKDQIFARLMLTEEEISAYLKEHPEARQTPLRLRLRHIVVKSADEAQQILKEVRSGNLTFADAAVKYSLAPESKHGGDLGMVEAEMLPPELAVACFALPVGGISGVLPSDYGFHLFKVEERHPAGSLADDVVRDHVEALLRQEKERQARLTKIASLREQAKVVIKEKILAKIH